MRQVFSLMLLLCTAPAWSQGYYDIKPIDNKFVKNCQDCFDWYRNKPKEVRMGFHVGADNFVFFYINNEEWFNKLIKSSSDGITADVNYKSSYVCDVPLAKPNSQFFGTVLPPIYLKELNERKVVTENNELLIPIGALPPDVSVDEIEFNLVILKNKYACINQVFYNLKTYRWDLLDMGFYFDSLRYKNDFSTNSEAIERLRLQDKVLRFDIPFEKNKFTYSAEDIRPLYDSLHLTDFTIQSISIRAFSSVEGDESNNVQLQNNRANSIVKALQSFQSPEISTTIQANENWVEFLNDVRTTPYKALADLPKSEIKKALLDPKTLMDLEPYLMKHRKAIVELSLQKKSLLRSESVSGLSNLFKKAVDEKNLEEAQVIQQALFEKVKRFEMSPQELNNLDIPQKTEFSLLLKRKTVFQYLWDASELENTYQELKRLEGLLPQDGEVKYNLCVINFRKWMIGSLEKLPADFKKDILSLRKYKISEKLIDRMLINYEIIMCEYYMYQRQYELKDKSLKFISVNYQSIPMTDDDRLNLGQFFSSYAQYDWAVRLIEPHVTKVSVSEDLLFYYLNLTLIKEDKLKGASYRSVLLNAYSVNPERFCEIFQSSMTNGITFQLLRNDFLKSTYCESCQ